MNTFSSWSQSETITSRLAAVLAVLVLASLPAVAKASPDIHLDLFGATEVTQLSEHQMSETRGEFFQNSYSWIIVPPYPIPIPTPPVVPCCYGSSDLGFSSSPGLNFEGGNGGGSSSGSGSGLWNRNLNSLGF